MGWSKMGEKKFIKATKYFLDIMFFSGIAVTLTLPLSVWWISEFYEPYKGRYAEIVMIYFVLGIAAIVIIRELRKIFATVIAEDCFVRGNVVSLTKMSKWSLFIVVMSIVRSIVYLTIAMLVVILVFIIAGMFSRVLAFVFEEAINYKEENELTI